MNCPQCNGNDVAVRTETSERKTVQIGVFWMRKETTTETKSMHRCLDCGNEWEDSDE